MLKSLLQLLLEKIGVLNTDQSSKVDEIVKTSGGIEDGLDHQRQASCTAPFTGYVVAKCQFFPTVVNLTVNSGSMFQVTSSTDNAYVSVASPCQKGDNITAFVLSKSNENIIFSFYPLFNSN